MGIWCGCKQGGDQGKAAESAGVSRAELLASRSRFQVDAEALAQELE